MSARQRDLGSAEPMTSATIGAQEPAPADPPLSDAALRIRPPSPRERRAGRLRHAALVAALALTIISLASQQPLFLLGAALLASLDIVPNLWYRYGLRSIRFNRRIAQRTIPLGSVVEVEVAVENRKPLPLSWLEVRDEFPDGLIVQGRTLAPSERIGRATLRLTLALSGYQRLRRRYQLLAVERGVYHLGPTTLRASDPFGIQTAQADMETPATLIVRPLVTSLERLNLPSVAPFGEHRSSTRLLDDPLRVSGIRDYAPGDDPRRIHWKATARAGALQSKIYDPSTRHALVIFLDLRVWAGQTATDAALSELAICAAASVATWAHAQRFSVGICANAPAQLDQPAAAHGPRPPTVRLAQARRLLRLPPSASARQLGAIQDGLGRLMTIQTTPMQAVLARELTRLPLGATVVYIGADSALDAGLLATLRRAQTNGHPVTLMLTQTEAAADTPLPSPALTHLVSHIIGGRALWQSLLGEALGTDLARRLTHGARAAFIELRQPAMASAHEPERGG